MKACSMQTSLSVPIDISFTLSVNLQKTTLHDLQRDIRRESRHALRRALRTAIQQIEKTLLSSPVACPKCKRAMRSRGRTARRIVTIFGSVELQRARYRCATCKTVRRPLDEWIGMLASDYTAAVREQALYLSADLPYERAADVLRIFGGIGISGRQIQRLLEAESTHIEAAIGAAAEESTGPMRRRFRRAGKHGASAGVARVMQLRQLKASGLWDEYWARRVRQEGGETGRTATPPPPSR
jgi:hypothetical protein